MNSQSEWYQILLKPEWAPPAWVFGPVWAVLYAIIFISFGYVFYKVWRGELPYLVAVPFVLNLIFNALFNSLQFGLQNNLLATVDILLVLGTLVWAMFVVYPFVSWVMYVNLPYFLWVSFATVLQFNILFLNW